MVAQSSGEARVEDRLYGYLHSFVSLDIRKRLWAVGSDGEVMDGIYKGHRLYTTRKGIARR